MELVTFHLLSGYFGFLHAMRYYTAKFKTITVSEGLALLLAMNADPVIAPVMAAQGSSDTAHSRLRGQQKRL